VIVNCEAFAHTPPLEVACVRRSPPLQAAVAASLIPRKGLIDVAKSLDLDLKDANDATGRVLTVDHNDEVARLWYTPSKFGKVSEQTCGCTFLAGDNLCRHFIGEVYAISESHDGEFLDPRPSRGRISIPKALHSLTDDEVVDYVLL
jgi:hypothetical protein